MANLLDKIAEKMGYEKKQAYETGSPTAAIVAVEAERQKIQEDQQEDVEDVNGELVKFGTRASAGTAIYSGYIDEEYLDDLRGKQAAYEYDKMRRKDGIIKMCLNAVKNPIKSADWTFAPKDGEKESEESKSQAEFLTKVIFHGLDKNWKKKLHEFLSFVDFGHAEVEITHKLIFDDPDYGDYIGLKSLRLLSQKTIERFNVNSDGELLSVTQISFGDTARMKDVDARWLLRLTIDQEGDNYEGISMLRTCFGPFIRRQEAFKQEAMGNQSCARPIPVGKYPEGVQNQESKKMFDKAIKSYGEGKLNHLIVSKGYEVEMHNNVFDSEKIRNGTINNDAREIVFSFLANFLMLGANGYGTGALSFDLSDFYLSSLEHIADEVCEVMNPLLQSLIRINFGTDCLVELKCSGIRDKFALEYAQILDYLAKNGILQPDKVLEEDIRRKLKLPQIDEKTTREKPTPAPIGGGQATKFSEARKKSQASSLIKSSSEELANLFQSELKPIATKLIEDIIKEYEKVPESRDYKVAMNVDPKGANAFRQNVYDAYFELTLKAYNQTMGEIGVKKITFAEKISNKANNRVKAMADLAVDTQIARIEQAVKLQYQSSLGSTDSVTQLKADMTEAVDKVIEGSLTVTGGDIAAADLVNKARQDIFLSDEVFDEIESFTFTNAAPKAQICIELNGLTVTPDDPRFLEYQTPLHHGCHSYWVANMKKYKDNPSLTGKISISKDALESVTLSEHEKCGCFFLK